MHSEGVKRVEIARIIGVKTQVLGTWVAFCDEGGVEALKIMRAQIKHCRSGWSHTYRLYELKHSAAGYSEQFNFHS